MDMRTGKIFDEDEINELSKKEKMYFVRVVRHLTKMERAQMQIVLSSPCGCGSGKKLKFCCHMK
jgi:uncharacterized protein YchJ